MSPLFYKSSGLWNHNVALSGMTPVAVNRRPSDAAVVAFAAEVAFDDLDHVDIVGALSHFKNGRMANFAFEPDSVKPVGKNDRRHSSLFGVVIKRDVAVFGFGDR